MKYVFSFSSRVEVSIMSSSCTSHKRLRYVIMISKVSHTTAFCQIVFRLHKSLLYNPQRLLIFWWVFVSHLPRQFKVGKNNSRLILVEIKVAQKSSSCIPIDAYFHFDFKNVYLFRQFFQVGVSCWERVLIVIHSL